jgi:hypothetical protein
MYPRAWWWGCTLILQNYMAFFFPTSTIGISGIFIFYCPSEKNEKNKNVKKMPK